MTSLVQLVPEDAEKLHQDSIKVSRIVGTIVSFIPLIACSIIGFFAESFWALIMGLVIAMVIFIFSFIFSKKSYDHSFYWFEEEGLYIQRGVFWRKKTLVPSNRVQHTDVSQGPLERKYNLAKLIVHTAGTRDATVVLPGLDFATANQLRSELQDEEASDAV